MHKTMLTLLAAALMFGMIGSPAYAWESTAVYYDDQGELTYAADADYNRIVDFSYAGYHNGTRSLPDTSALNTLHVSPVAGDDTAVIQQAINTVAAWMPNVNGQRGVVKLASGQFDIAGTLTIGASGVILSGSGFEDDASTNTILRRPYGTTPNKNAVIIVGGNIFSRWSGGDTAGNRINVTSGLVKVGDRSFAAATTAGLNVGDNIVIKHPATQDWLDAIGGGGTDTDDPWAVDSQPLIFNRFITAIDGNTITIDAPVTNTLDLSLSQSYIYKYDRAQLVVEAGVENLQVIIDTNSPTSEDHADEAILFNTVEDSWVDRVKVQHFAKKGITLQTATRVTVQNSYAVNPHSTLEGGRRYNFAVEYGQLNLFFNNYASYSRHAYIGNGGSWDSGNVFLDNKAAASYDISEPHRRWGHGFLYENHREYNVRSANKSILALYNRGSYGTGHGWSAAHSVLWNCDTGTGKAVVERPPTAQNYAIGCKGNVVGAGPFNAHIPTSPGFIEGTNETSMSIPSLYRAQLAERLGYIYTPTDDAYVRGGSYSNANYGGETRLDVKNGSASYDRDAYVKIDITNYDQDKIGKAILNFHVESDQPAQTIRFYGLNDDIWDEDTITWNVVPSASGAVFSGSVSTSSPGWYSVDATEYVKSQPDRIVSFLIREEAGAGSFTAISSKESTAYQGPFLIVTPK